ncbi:LCP family protein [Candidatus Saccharibacteria bacterium]|nr:LCP family protein [Candidatus Saccharibacteria bacterium]
MENFKRLKKGAVGKPKTVDGIISNRPAGKQGSQLGFRQPTSYLPESGTPLGSFDRREGFHTSSQDRIGPEPRRPQNGHLPPGVGAPSEDSALSTPAKKVTLPQRPRRWLKRLAWSGIGLFIVTGLVVGYLFTKGYINLHKVFKGGSSGAPSLQKNVDPLKLRGEGDGRVNILVLGKGGDGHEGPDLTDTLLVASVDPVNNEAALLSVPRDLWVKYGSSGSTKINAVYAYAKYAILNGKKTPDQAQRAETAGLQAVDSMVSQVLGIPIHYHVMVDFKAFQEAVNTVGGIDVKVTSPLRDTLWLEDTGQNYTINVLPGVHHFDGRAALVYARSRETSPRGDFDRTERQRGVILALKDKVFSIGTFSNPVKISQLISTFGNHVQANLTVGEILRLYDIAKMIDASKVTSVGLADPPNSYVKTAGINGLSVVVPRRGLFDYTDIQAYVRNTLKDGYIKKENPNIIILNGTITPGLATIKATLLRSYGYNVTQVGDAPTKNYTHTVLVDLRAGTKKYTQHYLERRFGVTAVTSLPDNSINPGTADFVIILGQNESTTN